MGETEGSAEVQACVGFRAPQKEVMTSLFLGPCLGDRGIWCLGNKIEHQKDAQDIWPSNSPTAISTERMVLFWGHFDSIFISTVG